MRLRLLLLFSVLNFSVYAQENKTTISGQVVAADDHQPVAYATVGLAGKSIATATNGKGEFIFLIPQGNLKDSLQVSCIGFKTQSVAISTIETGKPLTITLVKANIELKAVSVEYRDPLKIIQKAIDRVPENYITQPHVTRGFYRLYTRKGTDPLQLSEAVFDIYNFGYADKRDNLLKLIKARDNKNQRDLHGIEVGQRPRSIFSDDIVKHINNDGIFGTEGIKRHNFEVAGIVDFKGYQAYEIDFSEKPGIKAITLRGKVYIDTKTYAFLYFDYDISPAGMAYQQVGDFASRAMMKLMNIHIDFRGDHISISYRKVGGKWVLGSVKSDAAMYIKWPSFNYDFRADINFNYTVTSVDTTQAAPFDEKLGKNEVMENHDTNEGAEFWKDYNIILADFNTEDVVSKIKAINNITHLKEKFEERERKLPKDPALRIDSMLAYYHANGQFNGTALVKSRGKVILSKSYGYADKQTKQVANEQTTYRIGSTSKTFTSVIINQLVNEGKIDLHVPIKTYLPWYVHGDVTVDQLLTHQSGITEYFNNDDYKLQLITKSFSLKEVVQKFCSDSLEFKSGTGFDYSNSGFAVLALIAQEVTGKPFETLLQERVFTPLQMTNTYYGLYKGTDTHKATGYSEGSIKETIYDVGNEYGAGGISSSAEDLLKYHDALLTEKLLPKSQLDTMLRPRVEFKDYNAWYDYGWMTDKSAFEASKKHVITYHPGTDLGFFTMYVRVADTDSCIILLNNTGDFPRYDMADLILTDIK